MNKMRSLGYDIPGKDQPAKKSFIERVSEETIRQYQDQRAQDIERRKNNILQTKLFPALNEATQ